MIIVEYLSGHYVMLAELLGLWILLRVSVHVPKRLLNITRAALLLLFIDSVLSTLEVHTQSYETLSPWRPILSAALYSLQPIIMIVIMQMTAPMKKRIVWLLIPELANAVISIASLWTGWVCWFTEDNSFHGGPLHYLPYGVFAFYVIVFVVQSVIYFRRLSPRGKLGLFYVIAAPVVGVPIYLIFDISSDYSSLFTSAILLYYLFLYIHMSKSDPLTGLLNRQCYYRDSTQLTNRISAIASVDMNELKWLNDTKGHSAGDAALRAVADCLVVGTGRQKTVYRVGGDEFVVVYFGRSAEEVEADIERMRGKLAQTAYVCAFGYAMHEPGSDPDITLSKADEAMYFDKSALKRAVLEKGGKLHRRAEDMKVTE